MNRFQCFLLKITSFFLGFYSSSRGSFEITVAFVEGYKNNIIMLAQQKESRLFSKARQETQSSKADFYERVGVVDAQEILTRHGDTPILNTPHSRRMNTLRDAEYGDMIDKMDRVRLLINPDDAYVQAAVMSLNRFKDDRFIESALGSARAGEDGSTIVALPDTQKLACFDSAGTTTGVGLTVETIIACGGKYDANDVDESIKKYWAWTNKQKQNLMNLTKATSSDFVSVQALTTGKISEFYGFDFVRSERLPISNPGGALAYNEFNGGVGSELGAGVGSLPTGQGRSNITWAEDGMLSATGVDIFARIAERTDKRFGTQIYAAESVGCTRLEEEKVVEVICFEA